MKWITNYKHKGLTSIPSTRIEKPIFIFDLHGVLVKLNKRQVIRELLKSPAKFNIVLVCFNPYFLYTAIKLWCTTTVLEQFIMQMMNQFPIIDKNRQAALRVANALQIIPESLALLQKIHSQGHPIYIFSNIGEESIKMVQQQFPEIFLCVNGIYHSSATDNYVAKPSPQAFNKFFSLFNLNNKQNLIFIDDKPTNISAAQQLGIHTVFVASTNSLAYQLNDRYV